MKYFTSCKTIEDVKKVYHQEAKRLHPDAGGNAADFREMMAEYKIIFERLKNIHTNSKGETYTKEEETTETPEEYANIINSIIKMQGVKIEIIGTWIWCTGNTRAYAEDLKGAGFWWSKTKKAWYHNGSTTYKKRRGRYSMNQLRSRWGSQEIKQEAPECIA